MVFKIRMKIIENSWTNQWPWSFLLRELSDQNEIITNIVPITIGNQPGPLDTKILEQVVHIVSVIVSCVSVVGFVTRGLWIVIPGLHGGIGTKHFLK